MELPTIPGVPLDEYLPLNPGTKKPFAGESGWFGHSHSKELDPENYQEYLDLGADWGARMGDRCRVVCIDQDDKKAMALATKLGLRSACWCKTKRGRHDYFIVTVAQLAQLKRALGLWPGIDFLSTGSLAKRYPMHGKAPPPKLSAKQFAALTERMAEKKSNGAGDWDGAEIPAGRRNELLNAYLYRIGMENPDLGLREFHALGALCRASMAGGMPAKEFKATLRSAWNATREKGPPPPTDWPPVVSRETWPGKLANLAPRVPLQGPLKSSMYGLIYARGGVGKSLWGLGLGRCAGLGEDFGEWSGAGVPKRVLIWDGEMDIRDIADRLEMLDAGNVDYQLSQDWPSGGLNLCAREHQEIFFKVSAPYDLVILDNFLSLTRSPDTSNPYSDARWTELQPVRDWTHHTGKHLMWIDHANRQNQISGSLTKERDCDYMIRLKKDPQADATKFRLHFDKYRIGLTPADTDWTYQDGTFDSEKHQDWAGKVRRWKKDNRHLVTTRGAQAKCADEIGTSRQEVHKHW